MRQDYNMYVCGLRHCVERRNARFYVPKTHFISTAHATEWIHVSRITEQEIENVGYGDRKCVCGREVRRDVKRWKASKKMPIQLYRINKE